MAYLKLNGWTVPIKQDSGQMRVAEVATRGRSPNNAYFWGRSNRPKRTWSFETTPLSSADAQSLLTLLNQDGDYWDFQSTTRPLDTAVANLASQKGSSLSAAGSHTIQTRLAADGTPCYDFDGYAVTPWSQGNPGAVWQEPSSTNILSADNAHPTTNGHLTDVEGGTHAADTTRYWRSTASVAVSTTETGDGVATSATAASAATRYECTLWIRGRGASEAVQIQFADDVGGFGAAATEDFTLPANAWRRIRVVHTTAGGTTTVTARVLNNGDVAQTWNVAGLQVEAQAFRPTTWLAGTTSRTFAVNNYRNPAYLRSEGVTIGCWINLLVSQASTNGADVFWIGPETTTSTGLQITAGNVPAYFVITVDINAGSGRSYLSTAGSALTAGAGWKHLVGVYNPATLTASFYIDGTLVSTDTTWTGYKTLQTEDLPNTVYFGSGLAGLAPFHGPIAGAFVLPCALSASAVAGLYSATVDSPGLVPLMVSGDFLPANERSMLCHAVVGDVGHVGHMQGSSWAANNTVIRFQLEEA
jgi:hypothetical protein